MYKVLITTTYSTTQGAGGVHTVVVDFDSKEAADAAIEAIEGRPTGFHMGQTAIALYA